ncbi:MAG TPA: serpin family protein [Longimicrobium sp.]|jgi:serpin B
MGRALVRSTLTGLAAAALLAACEGSPSDPGTLTELPRPLTDAERALVGAGNQFALGLFRQVGGQGAENVFISPLSASMALGMTMNGARGQTLDEMRATLGFGSLAMADVNGSYRSLIELLLGLDRGVDVRLANSVWYRREFPFETSFLETCRTYFGAKAAGLDFGSPAAVDSINRWASQATSGRIDKIVEKIDGDDIMFLVNALYFKGSWRAAFDPAQTTQAPFHGADGVDRTVPLMVRGGNYRHVWRPEYQAVDLPYGNGAFVMTVVLPREGHGVDALVGSLDAARWQEITAALDGVQETEMSVFLPRFRVTYEKTLNDALKALGMPLAFTDAADFTALSPAGGVYVSEVLQKSFVEVNEEGTEAAAVTSVNVGLVSVPPSFRADRPFVFAIRERFSGTILFIGKIAKLGD